MSESDDDSFADPDYFLFTGPIWFVGPFPRPKTEREILKRVLTINTGRGGIIRTAPVIFSDLDLANKQIQELEKQRPDKAGCLKPISLANLLEFAKTLESLAELGHTHIAIDPSRHSVRVPPITRLIDAIRAKFERRPQPPTEDHDD